MKGEAEILEGEAEILKGENEMYAIFVNQNRYIPYAEAIVKGYKKIETRSRNVLRELVGKEVLVVRTMKGKPSSVVGSVTISGVGFLGADELDKRRDETLIPPGSKYDCHGKGKWCYHLVNAKQCTPYELPKVINHGRNYCEIVC